MKVIFIKDLRGQGKKGDIAEFKDGYATNFLIKKGYAKRLTSESLNEYNRQKEQDKQIDSLHKKEADMLKKKLDKIELLFKVKTGEKDRVFGSVSSKQIKDELVKKGFEIDKKDIELDHNLTSLGYHDIKINLYKEIYATIKVKLDK